MVWLLMRAATSTRVTFREEAPYSRKRPCSLDDDATWIVLEETMCVVSRSCPNSRRLFHPSWTSAALLPGVGSLFRERVFFSSLSSWHLPKVLILQSASARAGADRTFSDQYLGQVPRVKEDHLAREPEKAGIECISHGGSGETWLLRRGSVWDGSRGLLGSMNLFLSTTFQGL